MIRYAKLWCLVLLVAVLSARAAVAHHFKGLPHFSYFENYPQIPQEEFLGQEGQYEFSLVLYDFQGIERQNVQQPNDARLFLVIFNLLQNRVYNGPVQLEIIDRGESIAQVRRPTAEQESIYQINATLLPEGDYALRVTLEEDELVAEIPFELSSQKVYWGRWITAVLVGLIAVAAVGARRARIAQDRKRRK